MCCQNVRAAQTVALGRSRTPRRSKCNEPEIQLITRVEFEIYLNPVVDAVICQSDGVFKRTLALALEHDFVRLAANLRRDQLLKVT